MRWVAAISLAGMLVCAGLSLVPVHSMPLIIALFVGIFVSFIPAVVGHPATKMRGTHASVSGIDVARSAPLWLNVVVGAVLAYFVVLCLTTTAFGGGDSFGISDAELRRSSGAHALLGRILHGLLRRVRPDRGVCDALVDEVGERRNAVIQK